MAAESTKPIVAIDGPAGAGKSTVARLLARRLGYLYIDTGAMYRGIALEASRRGISFDDGDALGALATGLDMGFLPGEDRPKLCIDGQDVSREIRLEAISRGSSEVSRWTAVRSALVELQRRMAARGGVVMEGRDIGTVVFPDARAKIFLTATVNERVRRRVEELETRGESVDAEVVRAEVIERDRRDTEREHSPLRKAEDAVEVITDGLTIDEVVDRLERLVRDREQS